MGRVLKFAKIFSPLWRFVFNSFLIGALLIGTTRDIGTPIPCLNEQQATELLLPREVTAGGAGAGASAAPEGLRLEDLKPFQVSQSWRFGLGVPHGVSQSAWITRLGAGWWYSWNVQVRESSSDGAEFWQMIRLRGGKLTPPLNQVLLEARRRPGQVWLVGNEPDVIWQDGVSPLCLAFLYHQVYVGIKRVDPTARIAAGGITQASSLRLAYLDKMLEEYRRLYGTPLAADIWTMHAFILPEMRGTWGAEIPPGLKDNTGWLLGLADHDDLKRFRSQVIDFRQWMADHGYRDTPLVITEYGILMPRELGYGPERVQKFMLGTFDFLITARDPNTGLSSDEDRLVQQWAWFSLADPIYPNGNLADPISNRLTPLGMTYREYLTSLR